MILWYIYGVKLIPEQKGYEIVEINIDGARARQYRCHCHHQFCKGKYLRSRIGQTQCLFSMTQEQIDSMPLKTRRMRAKRSISTLIVRESLDSHPLSTGNASTPDMTLYISVENTEFPIPSTTISLESTRSSKSIRIVEELV